MKRVIMIALLSSPLAAVPPIDTGERAPISRSVDRARLAEEGNKTLETYKKLTEAAQDKNKEQDERKEAEYLAVILANEIDHRCMGPVLRSNW